jgi:hypothetical protein
MADAYLLLLSGNETQLPALREDCLANNPASGIKMSETDR